MTPRDTGVSPGPESKGVGAKAAGAFRTIGELSQQTGLPQHVLRYWETRFTQLRPLQRAGNRRYYRPDDVALVLRIDRLINREGYTVRGVQQMLKADETLHTEPPPIAFASLGPLRALLVAALAAD